MFTTNNSSTNNNDDINNDDINNDDINNNNNNNNNKIIIRYLQLILSFTFDFISCSLAI
jgi:hypothetical protein